MCSAGDRSIRTHGGQLLHDRGVIIGTAANIKVRKVPDWVIASFRSRAAVLGRSLEEELRSLLTEVAHARLQEFIQESGAFQESLLTRHGQLSDSTKGVTEDRRARWIVVDASVDVARDPARNRRATQRPAGRAGGLALPSATKRNG